MVDPVTQNARDVLDCYIYVQGQPLAGTNTRSVTVRSSPPLLPLQSDKSGGFLCPAGLIPTEIAHPLKSLQEAANGTQLLLAAEIEVDR